MCRQVRIVGDDDPWEVICETPTSMVLVNRQARRREEVAELTARLQDVRAQLAAAHRAADVDATRPGHTP